MAHARSQAAGELEAALQMAANQTRAEGDRLMARGVQLNEAEEVALSMFVLLDPEPKARLAPWESKEPAESERRYRKMLR